MGDMEEIQKKIDFLNNKLVELSEKIDKNEKLLESHYIFFENIYLYHDLIPKGIWNQIQLLTQELLSFIDNVCSENDLDYWLVYGTLLGAVRHQGFIPWDDDVDIGMMRRDFEKVYILLQQYVEKYGLSNDISVRIYHQNVKNIVMAIIQVSYKVPNNGSTMAYIDIFPFDFRETTDNFNEVIYEKGVRDFFIKMVNGKDKQQVVKEYMDDLNLLYDDSDYIVPATVGLRNYGGLMQYIIKKDVIFPTKKIQFKDRYFKCPNNCDAYLKGVFGDYLKIPKTVTNHGLLNRIKVLDGIENYYDDAIIKLKKVNGKFLE